MRLELEGCKHASRMITQDKKNIKVQGHRRTRQEVTEHREEWKKK